MKRYIQVDEDAEYREYYDSYRVTVDNLNDTDFLYKTSLSNGQVFFEEDEMYGFVNNQAAVRNRNITISMDYIDDFVIRDFKVYTRATNELISLDINCNLKNYRDGKPHFLYIVLSHNGTYEVHDDMFQTDETKILFARFIIDTTGNSIQFYMMLPFAGSADYIKGNQFYQVTDGLRLQIVNNSTKTFTLSDAKVRFSGINFDDVSSPDCLEIDFEGNVVPIRYISWDNDDSLPRVNWKAPLVNSLILDKTMNYSNGGISNVDTNDFTIQKLYYDIYEKCIVAMYGNTSYHTLTEAILNIDTILNYPLPDGIEYLIPIACVILKNTSEAFSNDTIRIINLDYNEQEVLDSDTFTRQQSSEAILKANQALSVANETSDDLNDHLGDRTNPHRVALNQLYNSVGTQIVLDDSYADYTVTSLISRINSDMDNIYFKKSGGTISGATSVSSTLAVTGKATFNENVIANNGIKLQKGITLADAISDIGTSSARLRAIYVTTINANGNATISGSLTTADIVPSVTNTSNIGTQNIRYNTIYSRNIDNSSSISTSSMSISGTLTSVNGTFSGEVTTPKLTVSNNGYLIIGNKALGLGGQFTPPTGISEAYAIY